MKEAEITVLGEKGQVVIPKEVRDELMLTPKTKFLVFGYKDTIVLKKLDVPDLREEWDLVRRIVENKNKKHGALSKKEIEQEIEAARRK